MREWTGREYWIVGASAGIGRAVAHEVSKRGAAVVLSARSEDDLRQVAGELPGRSRVVPVDVRDDDSVSAAAQDAGDVDGLIWLAGVYWPLSAREWDAEKVTAMCDVNLTGAARVLGHVVPRMVARDRGHIVLVGSLSGIRPLPANIGYGASKAGLMSLAETMRLDLRNTGVEVQLVNPGFVRTRLTDRNEFRMPQIMEPEQAAREIVDHMHDDSFRKNFPRALASALTSARYLPDWAWHRLAGRAKPKG